MKSKKFATYVKKNLLLKNEKKKRKKKIKMYLNYTIK